MKHGVTFLSSAILVALLATPLAAWADSNPDFDDDAKPILKMQPGLLHYVESRFGVRDRGTAKFPGDDDHRPAPPFIFRARPLGSSGPYNLRLLIQPGQPGHILGVVDITKVHINPPGNPGNPPSVASQAPNENEQQPPARASVQVPELSAPAQEQQPQPQAPAASAQGPVQAPSAQQPAPSEPTADTPSGPIMDNGSSSSNPQPGLAPPPDPAPSAQ